MPKETKKFINPLLRPSQGNNEPRTAPSSDAIVPASSFSEVELPSDTTALDVKVEQAPAAEEQTPPEVDSTTSEVVPIVSQESRKSAEVGENKSGSRESTRKPRSTMAHTSSELTSEHKNKHDSNPVQHVDDDDSTVYPAPAPIVTSAYNIGRSTGSAQNRSARSSRTGNVSSRGVGTDESAEYVAHQGIDSDEGSNGGGTSGSAPRRRRHLQSFESTHERITLWIDSQLKQDFEDLAQGCNTSKTALLDEAIADLLRKYHRYEAD